ncbi:MAG: hypothetical protein C3F13_10610 [Anaerolineales bacterium]|nr:MAG: hypothetical protein C3F13_10610 [Anaerolineales bacterium]
MKVITNEKLVKRYARFGQVGTIGGLVVLAGGMFITFRNPNYASLAWLALLLGFGLSQIGLYFGNRWGRHPRPDELLDQGLKGLNDQYTIYHYSTPAGHLLVGPTGLWVIMTYFQAGKIVYQKDRWKIIGGGFVQKYMRLLGQEGLGRPDRESAAEVESLKKFINKKLPDFEISEPSVVLAFVNPKAELEVDGAPIPTLLVKELKNTIRKSAKEKALPPEKIKQINELFP